MEETTVIKIRVDFVPHYEPNDYLTVQDVMKHLQIAKNEAYRLFNSENFPYINIGKNNKRVKKSDLDKFLVDKTNAEVA